jgi:O-antigen/teichoic acid export membrane protein
MQSSFWKTTFVYGIGFISLRMISFLLLPLYTHLLSPYEAGIIFIIYTILAFGNTIYSRGMDAALFKFYNQDQQISVINTSILYSIKYGTILSITIFILLQTLLALNLIPFSTIIVMGLLSVLFFDMISSRGLGLLRLEGKPFYYLLIAISNVCLSVGLNIYFIQYQAMGLEGAIWSIIIVSWTQSTMLLPILLPKIKINAFDNNLLEKMQNFSLPFLPAAVFLILIELSDRWMIAWLSSNGAADVGIYSTAYKFGSLIMLCVKGFNLNWQPYYLKKNTEYTFYRIGSLFLAILIILSTLITVLWPVLFYQIIGEQFWVGGSVIPIITISYIFYGLFILQMPSLYLKNKEKWAPKIWGAGFIINSSFNFILIPLYGYYGAAIATLLAYFGMTMFIVYKNYTWMPMTYNLKYICLLVIISMTAWLIVQQIISQVGFNYDNFIQYYILAIIYLLISTPLIWVLYKKT